VAGSGVACSLRGDLCEHRVRDAEDQGQVIIGVGNGAWNRHNRDRTAVPIDEGVSLCRWFAGSALLRKRRMTVRLTLVLSDDLIPAIDRVVEDDASSHAEVFRKALQLYLAAYDARRRGLKDGLVERTPEQLRTEIGGF
jgi:predicted transcriptional regulator